MNESNVGIGAAEATRPLETMDLMSPETLRNNFWLMAEGQVDRDDDGEITGINSRLENRLKEMRDLVPQESQMLRIGMGDDSSKFYVHNATIGLIEAAKTGMFREIDEGMDEGTQAVFRHLGDINISRSITPHMAPAIDAMLRHGVKFSSNDEDKTEFEVAYEAIRRNPVATVFIKDSLRKAADEGLVDLAEFNAKFYPPRAKGEPATLDSGQSSEPAKTSTDGVDVEGGPTTPELSDEEEAKIDALVEDGDPLAAAKKEYIRLQRSIAGKLDAFAYSEYSGGNDLSDEEKKIIHRLSYMGPSAFPVPKEELDILARAGVNTASISKMVGIKQQIDSKSGAISLAQNWGDRTADPGDKRTEAMRSVGEDLAEAYIDITHKFKADLKEGEPAWNRYFEQVTTVDPNTGVSRQVWAFKNDRRLRKEFQKIYVDEPMYKFFERIDRNTSSTYRDLFNPMTHGRYLEHVSGLLNGLRSKLEDRQQLSLVRLDENSPEDDKIKNSYAFTNTMINYGQSLQNYGQIFHDLPIFANDPSSIEKWGGILASLPPSYQAMFLDDPLIEMALAVLPRHIRTRLAMNGNKIPSDIEGGSYKQSDVIYSKPDLERAKEALIRVAKARLGNDVEDWEISRALTYAKGIDLLRLRTPEVIGQADIADHFRGIPDIVAQVWQRHKWNLGRGGTGNPLTPELLGAMMIRHGPREGGPLGHVWEKITRTGLFKPLGGSGENFRHDPEVIKAIGEASRDAFGEMGIDFSMLDNNSTVLELFNIFNLGSLPTRHGWRTDWILGTGDMSGAGGKVKHEGVGRRMEANGNRGPSHIELKKSDMKENWSQQEWNDFYDIITQEIGSGALWWYTGGDINGHHGGKAGNHVRRLFNDAKARRYIPGDADLHDYFTEGKKTFHRFDIKVFEQDGNRYVDKKIALQEIYNMQVNQARGQVLRRMMNRSPGDFLLTTIQMAPELVDIDTDVFGNGGDADTQKRRNILQNRFGDHGFNKLREIRQWIQRVDATYAGDPMFDASPNGKHPEYADPEVRRKAIVTHVINELGVALENLRKIDERRDDISRSAGALNLDRSHIDDPRLKDLIFGANPGDPSALMNKFDLVDSDFGDEHKINEHNFFYGLARAWSKANGDSHPDTADIDNFQVYEGIAGSGEQVIKRLVGDLPAWNEVAQQLMGIDEMIENIGRNGNLEPLYELCHHIFGLRKIVGKEAAEKANFYVASMVANYMWEHDLARLPVLANTPVGLLIEEQLGDTISLSRLRFGKDAHSMDSNAVRTMFKELGYDMGVIAIDGRWSYQHAKETFEATDGEWILGEVALQGIALIAILVAYGYIKKSLEEVSEQG